MIGRFTPPVFRRQLPPAGKPLRVYLAGKIAKHDWRAELLGHRPGWLHSDDWAGGWAIGEGVVAGGHDYVGPYFIGCDHGCAHGPATHGASAHPVDINRPEAIDPDAEAGDAEEYGAHPWSVFDCLGENAPDRHELEIADRCLAAIDRADVLFAWVTTHDAHGTVAEIGYARARGVPVFVAFPTDFDPSEMWFVRAMASNSGPAATPAEGFRLAVGSLRAQQRAAAMLGRGRRR